MKYLAKFYYLPFVIGIIISIVIWVSQIDTKLRAEGFAKLDFHHELSDRVSEIYWKNCVIKILSKFDYEKVMIMEKRGSFRFYSRNNDLMEIKKNYQDVKDEVKKYKEIYIDYIKSRIENELNNKKLSKKFKKMLTNSDQFIIYLSEKNFLQDLKTNELTIHNYQLISINLLISFLLSIILFNLKKFFLKR